MKKSIKLYHSGLSFTSIEDKFGRVTTIGRGYEEVIIVNRTTNSEPDSMRRYSIDEFEELTLLFEELLVSR